VGAHASAGAHVGAPLHVVVRRSTFNVQPSTFNLQRSTFNPARPSPRAARLILPRLAPRPKPLRSGGVTRRGRTCQCGRTCRYLPTRCRPTFNVQRATFNPSRPSPRPSRLVLPRLAPHPCIPSSIPPWNTRNAASHAMANCPSRLTSIQGVPNSCRFAASAATHGV
jgi:hypothetical protein